MDKVAAAYPDHRLAGVDAPTTTRATYLAYVTRPDSFRTVMIDPITGQILGELPERQSIVFLRRLHGSLLSGERGRIMNGIGAAAITMLCVTGVLVWWQRRRGREMATNDRPRRGRRWFVATHRTTGVMAAVFILMWAITGYQLLFPAQVRAVVHWISPVTSGRAPDSTKPVSAASRPTWREVIDEARRYGSGHVARVVVPANDRAAYLVLFADRAPTPPGPGHLTTVYLDQYSLQRLPESSSGRRSAGDIVMAWLTPIHVGGFGGWPVRMVWLLMGLAVPALALTGFALWWTRVIRPRR